HASGFQELKTEGKQPVLVFTDRGRSAGVAVDEILDIVEERMNIEITSEVPGQVGTAVLKGRATDVIDVGHFLTQACADWFEGAEQEDEPPRSRRILLVDDNAFFRNMMAPLLAAAGYDVVAVESADEAWSMRDSGEEFDIIVTDIEMPGMDGYEFAEAIKGDDRWSEVPVLALSGRKEGDDAERAPGAFADFVPKSDRASLIAALDYAIKNAGEAA
ncbi:MAG: response regulator, partial [Caulobacterales bacterium]|nr:response regulator [Caulobacterales bacterium]